MAARKSASRAKTRRKVIPAPSGDKEPLKRNAYQFVQFTKTALAPMFPYFDEGSIVPCTATFRGGPGVDYGRFQHFNTVDEVLLTFGSSGSHRGGGFLRVGAKLHMVSCPLEDVKKPEHLTLSVITQRQSIGKPQKEEVRFVCEKCDRRLFVAGYDAKPPKRGKQRAELGPQPYFKTIPETYHAAKAFNENAKLRKCKHCGHQNKPFPMDVWGWAAYAEQIELSNLARDAMVASQKARPRGGPATFSNRRKRR